MRRSSGSAKPLNRLADCSYEGEMTALPSHEDLSSSAIPKEELERMTDDMIAALKTVYDPEIPADIYELGLIYRVDVDDERNVVVDMTLTAPGCPVAGEMPVWVENAVASVPGVKAVTVNMVFDPPWDQSRMSDEARVALDMW
jgi:FeS assembly SUF system protein